MATSPIGVAYNGEVHIQDTSIETPVSEQNGRSFSIYEMMKVLAAQTSQDFNDMKILLEQASDANTANIVSKRLAGATSSEDLLNRIENLLTLKIGPEASLLKLKGKVEDIIKKVDELKAKFEELEAKAAEHVEKSKRTGFLNGLTLGIMNLTHYIKGNNATKDANEVAGDLEVAYLEESDTHLKKDEITAALDKVASKLEALESQVEKLNDNMDLRFSIFES